VANLLLTTRCVRSCPYCFARKEMENSPEGDTLSWENFLYVVNFLEASSARHISLLGGEPTLHPDFVDIILYLMERRFHVTVFTSGIMSEKKLGEFSEHLTSIAVENLNFVVNVNNPEQTPALENEPEQLHNFLSIMGPWCAAGFNIYRTDFEIDFIFDLIGRFGMKRHVRLGLASPIPGVDNLFISPENMKDVVARLYSYRPQFDRFRVSPGLDCGFPMCAFTDEQLGWIFRVSGPVRFGCGPAVDIMPDLSIYACFPLSTLHKRSVLEFNSLQEAADFYMDLNRKIRTELAGIFDECDGCRYREEGRCSGGGVCHLMNSFMDEAPVRLMEIESELAKSRLSSQP